MSYQHFLFTSEATRRSRGLLACGGGLDRHASLAMTTLPGADDALRQSLFRVEIASADLDSTGEGKYDADNQYYNSDPNKQVSAAHGGRGDPAEPE
jgi:hypothetical protein